MPRPSRLRLARRLCALWMLVLAPSSAWCASAPKNLLPNPGFEQGLPGHPWMPTAWDTSRAGLQSVFFGRDSFLVHSGTYAVSVANVSAMWPMAHNWSQTLPIPRGWWGKDAVFSVWSRSVGVSGRGYALVQAFQDTATKMAMVWGVTRDSALVQLNIKKIDDPVLDLGWQRESFSTPETDWVRREVRIFIPPSTNVLYVRCGLMGTGQVLFDDASLTIEPAKVPDPGAPNTNLLREPGFEDGGDAWEYSLPPYEGMHAILDSTVAHTGRFSVTFAGGERAWVQARAGVCQPLSNRNLAGKHLRLSGWVKTDSLKSLAFLKLYAHTLHGVEPAPVGPVFSAQNDWSLATVEMDTPPDTYEIWAWAAYTAPAPGSVYFDDLSLEVTGPAAKPKRAERRKP